MPVSRLVIAIGRNTHTLVYSIGDNEIIEQAVPNSSEAIAAIQSVNADQIIVVGNYQWALPLGFALDSAGIPCRFVPKPTAKGKRQSMIKFAQVILGTQEYGRPFPGEEIPRPKQSIEQQEQDQHPVYKMGLLYLEATDGVRRLKHKVMSMVAVLFPEAVRPSMAELKKDMEGHYLKPVPHPIPPDLWTKKMRFVLQNPDPSMLRNTTEKIPDEVRTLAQDSLGYSIPLQLRAHYQGLLDQYLTQLALAETHKKSTMAALKESIQKLPVAMRLVALFPDSETACVLAAGLGWRNWDNWRELQLFCGLAPTRIDDKGRRHISRVRGHIRQYLYLMAFLTTKGKLWSQVPKTKMVDGQEVRVKYLRVKRIKQLLRVLKVYALQSEPVPDPEL